MKGYYIAFWKKIPIFRLLIPLISGVIIQHYYPIHLPALLISLILCLPGICIYPFLNIALKIRWQFIWGLSISLLFTVVGAFLIFSKTFHNSTKAISNEEYLPVFAIIKEPCTEKNKSYKTEASIVAKFSHAQWKPATENILIYFKKEATRPPVTYGSRLVIHKPLQKILNSGNPGAFNYQEYCSFQGIYHQAFLSSSDYRILPGRESFFLKECLLNLRSNVLRVLKTYISGKNELSVAEALLIGYRDDLEKDLVQAYSNTGVVHIIAISGLHLGMIYGLLILIFSPFTQKRWCIILKPILVLLVIWGFTFLAGAAPSILRSAVMFSFIILGETLSKKTSIYNNLALSAFTIILFNPYSIWDVGFQLSYAAVLSISLFSTYIRNWFYFQNKLLLHIWNLVAVTLSAQILTIPIVVYHFHQFPTLFLFTNIIVVPLSALILYAELLLLALSWLPAVAVFIGQITNQLIYWMNQLINSANQLPISVWPSLHISMGQCILLYLFIVSIAWWLIQKKNVAFIASLVCMCLFLSIRTYQFVQSNLQQKIVVYNVPQHPAIDVMDGRKYYFIGDEILQEDGFLRNFHLQPSRILHRTTPFDVAKSVKQGLVIANGNKKMVIINQQADAYTNFPSFTADAIILSQNPTCRFAQLAKAYNCSQFVADASNPLWKIEKWKKEAEQLHLRFHSVPEQGAFIMDCKQPSATD
ncbi:MAG: ComEC/Rec2 family competence protein [Bacteroidota bacterium]|nr:ComEC/Rec2 family competence protein [Bacteroidota bacterium]